MEQDVLVSIIVNTYNHEKYISRAIESALAQTTNFKFEIIVGDDGSSDGTAEICRIYAGNYSDKIRLFVRKRSDVIVINGRPTGRANLLENLRQCTGKYIALLPGDDYWIDPMKLEKQVLMLSNDPTLAACCSHVYIVNDSEEVRESTEPKNQNRFTLEDVAATNFIFTSTIIYRAECLKDLFLPDFRKIPAGDYYMHIAALKQGDLGYINEPLAAYRKHQDGIWTSNSRVGQLANLVHTQYVLMNLIVDRPEALRRMAQAMRDHLDYILYNCGEDKYDWIRGIEDKKLVELLRNYSELHFEMQKGKIRAAGLNSNTQSSSFRRIINSVKSRIKFILGRS